MSRASKVVSQASKGLSAAALKELDKKTSEVRNPVIVKKNRIKSAYSGARSGVRSNVASVANSCK